MMLDIKNGRNGTVTLTSAYLEQNTPNPVNGGTTIIRYQVPQTSHSARLTLTNAKGQLVQTINISSKGAGQVTVNTSLLATGTYNYTLWMDGKQADTKRLLIIE
jgi:trimeric autotransporter adhesin